MRPIVLALKSLRRRPVFAAMTVLLLGMGVGAVGAIFSIVDIAFLRPLPYPEASRILWVSSVQVSPGGGEAVAGLVAAQVAQWRTSARTLDGLEGAVPRTQTVVVTTEPEPLSGLQVSAGFFSLLGGAPVRGRLFTLEEEQLNSPSAIVSHAFWQQRLGGDEHVIGRTISVDGAPRTIVGVMPKGFLPLFIQSDIYTPLALDASQMQSTWRGIISVARVRAGVEVSSATAELDRLNSEMVAAIPSLKDVHMRLSPLRDVLFGGDRGSLVMTLAAVLLLVVLAIANGMNLALSDGLATRQGAATRLALGATRASLARQRVAEAMILAAASAMVGLIVTRVAIMTLVSVNGSFFAGYGTLRLDYRVATVCLFTALIAAALAAIPASIAEVTTSIASIASAAHRGIGSRRENRAREALLASQVSIALILLFVAALLGKGVQTTMTSERGFDPAQLLAVRVAIPQRLATPDERSTYLTQMIDALANVPGVAAASASQVAFGTGPSSKSALAIDGVPEERAALVANMRHVMPGLLPVMRIKVQSGRAFDEHDREGGRPVAIVSTSFARQFLPPGHAIGARVRRTAIANAPWMEVIGVVDDVRDGGPGDDLGPSIYVPYRQDNQPTVTMMLLARLQSPTMPEARAVKAAIWSVDRTQAIARLALVSDLAYESAAAQRFQALLVALFGGAAMVLVGAGIYALTLFNVLKRTREIGLRSALGAEPQHLLMQALRQGLRPVAVGILAGLVLAYPVTRAMARWLGQEMQPNDLRTLAVVIGGLLAAAAVSAFIPALRATRVSPINALRM